MSNVHTEGVSPNSPGNKIAVLIDADNIPHTELGNLMEEISKRGRIALKRAYGNWGKDHLKNWEKVLKGQGIKAVQQFAFGSTKNATDMALTIDAVYLLHQNQYDTFVLVSSDSDFIPLVIHLREQGANVICAGKKDTSPSLINSCDDFIPLRKTNNEIPKVLPEKDNTDQILKLVEDAYNKSSKKDKDNYVHLGLIGKSIREKKPEFKPKGGLAKFIDAHGDRFKLSKNRQRLLLLPSKKGS